MIAQSQDVLDDLGDFVDLHFLAELLY